MSCSINSPWIWPLQPGPKPQSFQRGDIDLKRGPWLHSSLFLMNPPVCDGHSVVRSKKVVTMWNAWWLLKLDFNPNPIYFLVLNSWNWFHCLLIFWLSSRLDCLTRSLLALYDHRKTRMFHPYCFVNSVFCCCWSVVISIALGQTLYYWRATFEKSRILHFKRTCRYFFKPLGHHLPT